MDHLSAAMRTIRHDWGMVSNEHELAAAVHVIQGFVIQRMLHRLDPSWPSWTGSYGGDSTHLTSS